MRIPKLLAWLLIAMALFTAGLLRHFHDLTPTSPFLNPAVGSLLFACVVFVGLVSVRERQIGASPGPGVRLGSVTPLLLMLLLEQWISSAAYVPAFALLAPLDLGADAADAWFRALCGVALLLIVAGCARLSAPARAFVAARVAPRRILPGMGAAVAAVAAAYAVLAGLAAALGSTVELLPPSASGPVAVVLAGQAVLALAEEAWFRGLLLGEVLRLAPRLGLSGPSGRRWVALAATALLFGGQHFALTTGVEEGIRQLVFALALGMLFGMLVLLTSNLWFTATLHAWVNWYLLGALPRLAYGPERATAPPGPTISLVLIAAFVAAYLLQRRGYTRTASSQSS